MSGSRRLRQSNRENHRERMNDRNRYAARSRRIIITGRSRTQHDNARSVCYDTHPSPFVTLHMRAPLPFAIRFFIDQVKSPSEEPNACKRDRLRDRSFYASYLCWGWVSWSPIRFFILLAIFHSSFYRNTIITSSG